MRLARNRIIVGDAAEQLSRLPAASVDMILTSPPYFRLRDYQIDGQLGLEDNVNEWADVLREVAGEARRVLTPTGTFWLNLGDTYATHARQGAARKSLLLGPERLALALVQDGWLLRNKIVWQKANPMPTSARDRLACVWEIVYVFARQPSYFFDLDAIRAPHRSTPPKPTGRVTAPEPREPWRGPNGEGVAGLAAMHAEGRVGHPLGKNPGDVWRIPSSSYRGPHHATFPVRLASRAIQAGCPESRCRRCRTPWRRPLLRQLGATALRGALAPGCDCGAPSEPGLVLDPFIGAGTTAVAAEGLSRQWLGIELNPDFAALAETRIRDARASPPQAA
jgi:site-specific DNA-methyltransferase (adenine-specific)